MHPIHAFSSNILATIAANTVTIVTAETGAGKTTVVPQILANAGMKAIITEPRVLAARNVATFVAKEMGCELGSRVGYRTAEERVSSAETQILFCTDGLALVRELLGNSSRDILVLDEVHEWNKNLEVLVAWARRELSRGASFKLVLMSATMEAEKLSAFFDNAPVITVPGRLFPVAPKQRGRNMVTDTADLVTQSRNVLVFQTGKAEIDRFISDLRAELSRRNLSAELLPLYGELDPKEQQKCFAHHALPKVVVATNVAQTSITIDDIDAVVDCGEEKRIEVVDGVEGLYTRPISIADATQRKGRAGRCKEGIYIDHCPVSDGRPQFPTAEIMRVRLDMEVLRLLMAGIDMEELELFHQPDRTAIHAAKSALRALGCIDEKDNVTKIGRQVARLPLAANLGRMVVEAHRLGVLEDVISIAAILQVGGFVDRKDSQAWMRLAGNERESDLIAQLNVLRAARDLKGPELRENGIITKPFFRVKEIIRNIHNHLPSDVRVSSTGNREYILKAVCSGMVDHLYYVAHGRLKNGGVERELARESVVRLGIEDKWLVGVPFDIEVQGRRGPFTIHLVTLATKIQTEWLTEVAPQLVKLEHGIGPVYNPAKDSVCSTTRTTFNGAVVKEKTVEDGKHPQAAYVFATWLAGQMV